MACTVINYMIHPIKDMRYKLDSMQSLNKKVNKHYLALDVS